MEKGETLAILGQNGLTEIKNANNARIRGIEADLSWAATYNLTLSSGLAFYDPDGRELPMLDTRFDRVVDALPANWSTMTSWAHRERHMRVMS